MKQLFESQKQYYQTNETKSIELRIHYLKLLKKAIKENEALIVAALEHDLGKCSFEAYATEIGIVYDEISYHLKHIKKWTKNKTVKSPIFFFKSKSFIQYDPYGTILIIGPFNYPFQLVMMPVIGAISAGNTCIVKPSELTPTVSKVIIDLFNQYFDPKVIVAVDPTRGKEVVEQLLDLPFDLIFFTGSNRVGKIVMERAAKHLTPVILELGGKSPCLVDKDANIEMAAKRIVWGKLINAGQTCVAPDYLYVHEAVKEPLIEAIKNEIQMQYGSHIETNPEYPKVVNKQNIERLSQYLKQGNVVCGGHFNAENRYFEPTIIEPSTLDVPLMQEELFGPILPIITFNELNEAITFIESRPHPLALYYFGENKQTINYVLTHSHSGGVTINDTILHVSSKHLPFGGIGTSGMGVYHGHYSFLTFSHQKGIVIRSTRFESKLRYPPYNNRLKLVKKIMK